MEDAKSQLDGLPYTLPVYFYSKEDMLDAYNSAKKTLEGFPDHAKRNELSYILLNSSFSLALGNWSDRKSRLDLTEKDYNDYSSIVSKKKSIRLQNTISYVWMHANISQLTLKSIITS